MKKTSLVKNHWKHLLLRLGLVGGASAAAVASLNANTLEQKVPTIKNLLPSPQFNTIATTPPTSGDVAVQYTILPDGTRVPNVYYHSGK